ncbi:DUF6745 domain-containing protein, partial [Streptomyces sp. MCAF7]
MSSPAWPRWRGPRGGGGRTRRPWSSPSARSRCTAPWLAAVVAEGDTGELAGLAAVARSAGWWWPYEKAVVIAERPVTLHRDEAGRLDSG